MIAHAGGVFEAFTDTRCLVLQAHAAFQIIRKQADIITSSHIACLPTCLLLFPRAFAYRPIIL